MSAPARGCPPGSEFVEVKGGCFKNCAPSEERNQFGDCEGKDPRGASRNLLANMKDPMGASRNLLANMRDPRGASRYLVPRGPTGGRKGRNSRSRHSRKGRKGRKGRKTRRS